MTLFDYGRRLYSLDTLDTRFTASSRPTLKQTVSDTRAQIDPAKPSTTAGGIGRIPGKDYATVSPSKWRNPEFFVYYFVILVAVPMMFKVTYDVSKPSHPNYSNYARLLSPGWIPGRKVDNSDNQYATFRDNLPYMFLLLLLHPLLRRLYDYVFPVQNQSSFPHAKTLQVSTAIPATQIAAADARLTKRVTFDLYFGVIFLCALHGFSAFKVLLLLSINFALATQLPYRYVPAATWIFNIGVLFANELCKGYPLAAVADLGLPWSVSTEISSGEAPQVNWGSLLDSYGGLVPRWEILFNFTVLRLISFNFDHYWSFGRLTGSPEEKKQLDPTFLSERDRVDLSAKARDYSFRCYLAYTLYSPLYLTGPIVTFNDYISQLRYPAQSITTGRTFLYGVRFLVALLTMEVMLHFIYAVAISKAQPAWEIYTPFQLSMLGYFNLHIIWLKLLLPWRFFRLWALLDGIDPPENMVRCMSNNYSTMAFWRAWHRSFNRWIVRYIYIPLGGSGGPSTRGYWGNTRAVLNFLAVFTFVALWHDIQLRLLVWGWLITLFILPEVLAGFLFPKKSWQNHKDAYRVICGIGAVGNILMMMAANLVGFAVGLDGLMGLVHGIVGSSSGLVFLGAACAALFVGVQVMFETREQELREGFRMTC